MAGRRFRPGCTANDIVVATSADGVTWSAPVRVPAAAPDSAADHVIPGLGVNRATSGSGTELAVTYYSYPTTACTTATCQLNVGFISSGDGGQSWSAPVQLNPTPMSLSWLAQTDQGAMVGDYISTSFAGSTPVAVFSLAGPKDVTFHQAIHAARLAVGPAVRVATTTTAEPVVAEVGPGLAVTFPNLTGVLRTAGGVPVPGRTVSFSAGGQPLCTATTDAAGRATCSGVTQSLQALLATRYQASFAGDTAYLPSSANGPVLRLLGSPLP